MMKILLPLVLLSTAAMAQSNSEEAIILNQEMQFLEDSARDMEVRRPQVAAKTEAEEEKSPEELSLERTYFSDSERDEIRTKAAAPRRTRSF